MPTATEEKIGGYLALRDVTVTNVNGDSFVHHAGTVLSDWEVAPFVKSKISEGSLHYRTLFEPLTQDEVFARRSKATALEGDHVVDGQHVSPPWEDYVGLHPEEIIDRMRQSRDKDEILRVKLYEKGGMGRSNILEYVAPAERPPWIGYDEMNVREVLEKLPVLSDEAVQEVLTYEFANHKRPAIVSYEPEPSAPVNKTEEKS